MHIAMFSPGWPLASYPNGIVTYVHCMRQELVGRGHKVSVFSSAIDPAVQDDDVHPVTRRTLRTIARAVSARVLNRPLAADYDGATIAAAIRRVGAGNPIDVVEMEESFGLVGDVARDTDLPVVCKLHGPTFLTLEGEELTTPFAQEKIRREGDGLKQLSTIIAPSRCTLSDTLQRYGLHPPITRQIVNPLPRGSALPLWNLSTCDRRTLLFVGRFDSIKGADVAIHAFRRLLDKRPELKLVFVGPDSGLHVSGGEMLHFREFLASIGDSNLERAVSYHGRLNPAQIIALRPTAFATIVSSRRETQSYTALEAMLQGCPLVCTDTTGLSELVEHGVNGLKARSDDPEDLATQICRLIDHPELAVRLALAGREHVIKEHAPGTVVEEMLGVYRETIDLHRTRRVVN